MVRGEGQRDEDRHHRADTDDDKVLSWRPAWGVALRPDGEACPNDGEDGRDNAQDERLHL
jgi:hypothetical protein